MAMKIAYVDELARLYARDSGLRVCDDCDFTTEEGDCIVCPHCRGSVG
jgi:uncharacterized paraquat-inducible protein A